MRISYMFLLGCLIILTFQYSVLSQSLSSSIKSLSEDADIIITGKVINQSSGWNNDKSMINTLVTVRVDDLIKGSASQTVTVIHPGGEVGDAGEYYSHIPVFKIDEEVLLFLKKDQQTVNYRVMEGESGKFRLYNDPVTGEKITAGHKKAADLKQEIRSYVQR